MPKGEKVRIITERQDEVIRKCWEHNGYGHHAAKRAAELTGLTTSVTHRRAMELGLVFTRERFRWTEPELKLVEENAHLALETIQRKLARGVSPRGVKRTRAAIAGQIHHQRFRTNMDGLKHGPLADALGISTERLHQFRSREWIIGKRLESVARACGYTEDALDAHRHWFYHNDEIVRLLFAARGELDFRKANQTWLMGLLEPYITLFQITPKLARRRRRRQRRKRKRQSTASRRSKPGVLAAAVVDAIRAGRRVLSRRGPMAGAPASLPAATGTGPESKQTGGTSGTGSTAIADVRLPSGSRSSGPVGAPSAGWPIAPAPATGSKTNVRAEKRMKGKQT